MPPQPDRPESYPCRVLLAVTGLSPQVVTETIYALARTRVPPFIPTEIHLLTSAEGAERARLALLSDEPGWFARLRRDYALPEIRFGHDTIHVLAARDGEPLADIRTCADNDVAADFITDHVRRHTADPDCALHVSLAGGRKTMGYYLGYALSLFGRAQDRLSHVLVSEPFESSWTFFYPTPYECIIETRDKKLADCARAEVSLADIPFVRLRDELPRRLLEGAVSFTRVVAAARRALEPPRLELTIGARTAIADGEPLHLSPMEFALLLWFAERARGDDPEVDLGSGKEAEEFLACASRVFGSMSAEYERCERAVRKCKDDRGPLLDYDRGLLLEYFNPTKSRLAKTIEGTLGAGARRYAIERRGRRTASRYALPLSPEQIVIRS